MKKLTIGVLILMCQSGLVFAGPGGPNGASIMQRMQQELQLTDQQAAQLRQIMREEREKIHALMQSGEDRQQVRSQSQSLRNDMRQRLARILNPEQLQKFDQMRTQMRERFRQSRGDYGNGPGQKRNFSE